MTCFFTSLYALVPSCYVSSGVLVLSGGFAARYSDPDYSLKVPHADDDKVYNINYRGVYHIISLG